MKRFRKVCEFAFIGIIMAIIVCTGLFSTRSGKDSRAYANYTTSQIIFRQDSSQYLPASATRGEPLFTTDTQRFYIGTGSGIKEFNQQGLQGLLGETGYDGRPGAPPLTCYITGGVLSLTYDAVGLNPVPAMVPFSAQLYNGGTQVTPLRYAWSTGPVQHQIYGSSTGSTFTPDVLGTYSANRANNRVIVQLPYSTATAYGGKRTCTAVVPIAVTRIGQQGIPGIPGDLSNMTQTDVFLHAGEASDVPQYLRPSSNTGTVSKFEVWDYWGTVRNYINSSGYQFFKDANGHVLAKVQTDGTLILMDEDGSTRAKLFKDGSLALWNRQGKQRVFINATTAGVLATFYRGDGTTPAFQILTSGRTFPAGGGGTPGGNNRQLNYNSNGSFAGTAYHRYTTGGNAFSGTNAFRGGTVVIF